VTRPPPHPPGLPDGSIEIEHERAGAVMHLRGDVDAPVIEAFEAAGGSGDAPVVAVDVGELTYIDSSGLSFLARWAQQARREGRSAVLRRATARFDQMLELTGLTPLFVHEDDGASHPPRR
jgi:anti-sigma B factor antagonist